VAPNTKRIRVAVCARTSSHEAAIMHTSLALHTVGSGQGPILSGIQTPREDHSFDRTPRSACTSQREMRIAAL
jgi:hypothetical protein